MRIGRITHSDILFENWIDIINILHWETRTRHDHLVDNLASVWLLGCPVPMVSLHLTGQIHCLEVHLLIQLTERKSLLEVGTGKEVGAAEACGVGHHGIFMIV